MEPEQLRLPDVYVGDLCGCQGSAPRVSAAAEITRLRAAGLGPADVARSLNRRAVPTPSGRGRWWRETVLRHADPTERARYNEYMRRYKARQALRG